MFCGEERQESYTSASVDSIISLVTVPVSRMEVFLGDQLYKFPSEDLAELEVSHCIE